MQSLIPGSNQTIMFKQQISMGLDTSVKYYSYSYVNVYMALPSLVINITGPKIGYFNSDTTSIVLDGSSSYDPLGSPQEGINSYSWQCPSYLGLASPCSTTVKLTLTSAEIPTQYLDMSHQINLTIVSSDLIRTQF